jgi:hypothetical protein
MQDAYDQLASETLKDPEIQTWSAEEDGLMAIRDRLTTPRCMNKIDWMQFKSKRKDMQLWMHSWVCHAATQCSVCNTWCIYDNNEHTLVGCLMVASIRIGWRWEDAYARCMGLYAHGGMLLPLPHQSAQQSSLRAYELTSLRSAGLGTSQFRY